MVYIVPSTTSTKLVMGHPRCFSLLQLGHSILWSTSRIEKAFLSVNGLWDTGRMWFSDVAFEILSSVVKSEE
jgi:hypothetical protein